jgi:integrase/ribosomal protein L40E
MWYSFRGARQYGTVVARLDRPGTSKRNKNLILSFDRTCVIEGLGKPRRIKLICILAAIARNHLRKDLDKVTKEDLLKLVAGINAREDLSPWTKQSYLCVLKKFYKWLKFGDNYKSRHGYPRIIDWIHTNVKSTNKPRIEASSLLTEQEIEKLIKAADRPRDKAFISMLYELGARIGEIGNLRIKDVVKDKYSYIVNLKGKTGQRTPRIVISDPYISVWLNTHPDKDNPEAPLWVRLRKSEIGLRMQYPSLRALVQRRAKHAGIQKRIYPHLFRHTRVTHLLLNKQINEAQAKVYFGWTPSSTMLSEYSHLVSSDVNDTILAIYGIKTESVRETMLKPKVCQKCGAINAKDARFCQKCSSILDVKTAIELDSRRSEADEILNRLIKDPDKLRELATLLADARLIQKLRQV